MADSPLDPGGEVGTELGRDLGLPAALSIGVGTMIAAGIFTLSGLAVSQVGSAAIVAFLLAGVAALLTALPYCEFASIYPDSGGGYLYARKTFAPPLAYLVGWCLLLAYTASCGFYIASLSVYFVEFIWRAPLETAPGLIGLVALTLLNIRGTKESATFQIAVTAGKVLLLAWFIIGGIGSVDAQMISERFIGDFVKIGGTAAMVFITFFGFSAVAASAGEFRDPTKTIPRAIFWSMGIVTVLYALVVLVIIAAELTSYDEASMGVAATRFLGPIGGTVIVGGALFSMISASNASIIAASRVVLSMSRRGHLPEGIGAVNAKTRTPIVALLLVGGGISVFALLLPLEPLAHFANCVLIVSLILVNVALISHRRKHPNLHRPFKVPFGPFLAVLGIAANVYLLTLIPELMPVLLAALAVLAGFLGFLAWKGSQPAAVSLPGSPSRVGVELVSDAGASYRVAVPIANPANVDQLVDIASAIADDRQGEVVALAVVALPMQLPEWPEQAQIDRERQLLEKARARAREHDVPASAVVRIGRSVARGVLEAAQSHACNLVVLGWKGRTSTARRVLGDVTDDIVRHAQSDVMLVKLVGPGLPRRVLLPSAGGVHAQRAAEYAASIVRISGGSVTLCSVVAPDAPASRVAEQEQRLAAARDRIRDKSGLQDVGTEIIRNESISAGIIDAAADYDGVVLGATGDSLTRQVLFGTVAEDIAKQLDRTVIVVKRHQPVRALIGRVMNH